MKLLGNAEDARDMSQDVFLRVYNSISKFRLASSFSTWLYAITVNACLKELDRRKRSPWWWFAEDIDRLAEEDEELLIAINENKEEGEPTVLLEEVLQRVGPTSAEVLRLRFVDEMDYDSISRKLGIGLSATKMRLKRAREMFKSRYWEICEQANGTISRRKKAR
jgi:RNA polymerase sigma-70 factor (ECF subfamily)